MEQLRKMPALRALWSTDYCFLVCYAYYLRSGIIQDRMKLQWSCKASWRSFPHISGELFRIAAVGLSLAVGVPMGLWAA